MGTSQGEIDFFIFIFFLIRWTNQQHALYIKIHFPLENCRAKLLTVDRVLNKRLGSSCS